MAATKVTTEQPSNDLIKQVQTICHKHKITDHEANCILEDDTVPEVARKLHVSHKKDKHRDCLRILFNN